MQTMAETWTDGNGLTWSFTVNGTEATDIKFYCGLNSVKIYLYGDPNNSEQQPFVPGAWDAAAMRFSSTEGTHLPTIPDDVYFGLKTLIFDVSDVTDNFDLKVMNGWWSNLYYDHVKWENGLNELQITEVMANECAKGGEGRDLDLMLYSGSMTLNAVYYESSEVYGDLVIPAKVYAGSTELTVTSIGNAALVGCAGLTSVTIPETVTSIGNYAFVGCAGLTSMTIPSSVTSIGKYAFFDCSGLTSVTIPEGVTSINEQTFCGCAGLTSVTIPSSVTSIGNYAFYACTGLTSVTIPESVTSIGEGAFEGSGLTSVIIPSCVTSIGNNSFYACTGLTSVTIPSSVTSIGKCAFGCCFGLTSVTISEGVTNIGEEAFGTCISLTSVTIPSSVTSIGNNAFYGCSGLKSITILEGVMSIGNYAFCGCSGLTSVTIPSSVTSIGNCAFSGCTDLTSVISLIEEPFDITEDVFMYYYASENPIFTSATLYVPVGTKSLYEAKPAWNQFQNIEEMVGGEPELEPIENETIVSTENLGNEDLTDNIVDDVYYNVGDNGYDTSDGSVVIGETTNMGQIGDATPGSSDIVNNFTGLILKVAAGKGTIKVNVKTTGNAQLVVQIGNQTPMIAKKTEQGDVVVNYDVAEDTYVYIYAIIGSSSAPSHRSAPADAVKIYSITVTPGATGIQSIDNGQLTMDNYYTLDGRKQEGVPTKKGLYIVNGRKVVMK